MTRLFTATERWFGFGPSDVTVLVHSSAFDLSVWEIWDAPAYGGRLPTRSRSQGEDTGMDRLTGAPQALEFVRSHLFDPPNATFDAAFSSRSD